VCGSFLGGLVFLGPFQLRVSLDSRVPDPVGSFPFVCGSALSAFRLPSLALLLCCSFLEGEVFNILGYSEAQSLSGGVMLDGVWVMGVVDVLDMASWGFFIWFGHLIRFLIMSSGKGGSTGRSLAASSVIANRVCFVG
jgi:hypothetical protein